MIQRYVLIVGLLFTLSVPSPAALIDKLQNPGQEGGIACHSFSAAMLFWALGEVTRAQVITTFSLVTADEAQLDAIAAHYTGLSAQDKRMFHARVEAATILLQEGYITPAKYKTFLGMAP